MEILFVDEALPLKVEYTDQVIRGESYNVRVSFNKLRFGDTLQDWLKANRLLRWVNRDVRYLLIFDVASCKRYFCDQGGSEGDCEHCATARDNHTMFVRFGIIDNIKTIN